MEHPTPNPEPEQQPGAGDATAERPSRSDTRIYVASLADYNDGRLHGAWIDADTGDLAEQVQMMLARSPLPNAEEYAIHDYEGFGPLHLGEHESLATISQLGQGIAEHGAAYAHWAAIVGTDPEDLGRFEDVYLGHWDAVEDYADELLGDLGITEIIERHIPDSLQAYVTVDVEAFARDLQYSGDITASEGDRGVYLFDHNR